MANMRSGIHILPARVPTRVHACPRVPWVAATVFIAAGACTGSIATSGASGERATGNSGGAGSSTTNPSSSTGGGGTGASSIANASACNAQAPAFVPPARVWRLSGTQYANTVKQVFGVDVSAAAFPLDGVADDSVTRFDTNSEVNLVTDQLAGLYDQTAEQVATAFVAAHNATSACVLGTNPSATCVSTYWSALGRQAYRRPLTSDESTRLSTFFTTARTQYDAATAATLTIEAMLESPYFLYRSELGGATGARVPLSQHEIASELSYFLADMPPDAALAAAADAGTLTSPAALQPHATRLLALPSARAKVATFFATYLGLKGLIDGKTKDATLFPTFEAQKASVVADALAAVQTQIFNGTGTLEALLSQPVTLGSALTTTYGSTTRPGIITHPGVIAGLSNPGTTSPVHRGLFFYQTLLCRPIPVPPANASSQVQRLTDPNNPNGTQREAWAYFQTSSPTCAACHHLFQPIGLGLENYDPIGRYRTTDNGKTIDPHIDLTGYDNLDGGYDDGVALATRIAGDDNGRRCFALQYSTFAFGRKIDPDAEACRLDKMASQVSGRPLDVQSFIVALTNDDSFFYRSTTP